MRQIRTLHPSLYLMFKGTFHILISMLLVLTTTASIWDHLIADVEDPIEISKEADGEKGEKESEKELDDWDDDLSHEASHKVTTLYSGLQKTGSSSFTPVGEVTTRLYIQYHRLKVDC